MSCKNCFCLTPNDEIMHIFLHISLKREYNENMGCSRVRFRPSDNESRQAKPKMKFKMLSGSISLKQEKFRLGDDGSRPSEQIFARARKNNIKLLFLLLKA